MGPPDSKALVRRYYEELWNAWDLSLADELLAPDLSFRGSLGVETRGRDAFLEYVSMVRQAFPDFENKIEEVVAEGDKVVARLTYSGTQRGPLMGFPPTSRRVRYAGVAIFRVVEGMIAEAWVLGDLHGLLEQLRRPSGVSLRTVPASARLDPEPSLGRFSGRARSQPVPSGR